VTLEVLQRKMGSEEEEARVCGAHRSCTNAGKGNEEARVKGGTRIPKLKLSRSAR
jgi:hypothetical protein